MTEPLHQWGEFLEQGIDNESPVVWPFECDHFEKYCAITPEDYYKIIYLRIKNGFPFLIEEPINYSLETLFNTSGHRSWIRSKQPYVGLGGQTVVPGLGDGESFWDNCEDNHYFAALQFAESYNNHHYKLQNGQEIRFSNLAYCVVISSGKESKTIYHNISDSWVDVGYKHTVTEDHYWRVHGRNPDPWDAPQWLIDSLNTYPDFEWPDPDPYVFETCYHLSSNAYGTIQYPNIDSIEDLYRTEPPTETHIMPVKGAWSGFIYDNPAYNEFVYNTVSTQFKKIRIEKYVDYHRIFISYGEGAPTGAENVDPTSVIGLITAQNKWDSKIYGITFDLLPDGSIITIVQQSGYIFPTDTNETIILDTELDINKLSPKAIIPTDYSKLLSSDGIVEFNRIYDELTADWISQGWLPKRISVKQSNSLVKK